MSAESNSYGSDVPSQPAAPPETQKAAGAKFDPVSVDDGWQKASHIITRNISAGTRVVIISSFSLAVVVALLMLGTFRGLNVSVHINALLGNVNRPKILSSYVVEQADLSSQHRMLVSGKRVTDTYTKLLEKVLEDLVVLLEKIEKNQQLNDVDFISILNRSVPYEQNGKPGNSSTPIFSFGRDSLGRLSLTIQRVPYNGEQTALRGGTAYVFASQSSGPAQASTFAAQPATEQKQAIETVIARVKEARQEAEGTSNNLDGELKRVIEDLDIRSQRFINEISPDPFEAASKIVLMLTLYTIAGALIRIILSEFRFRNSLSERQVDYSFVYGLSGQFAAETRKRESSLVGDDNVSAFSSKYLDKAFDVLKVAVSHMRK